MSKPKLITHGGITKHVITRTNTRVSACGQRLGSNYDEREDNAFLFTHYMFVVDQGYTVKCETCKNYVSFQQLSTAVI